MNKQYVVDGFAFSNGSDYKRAQKEQQIIERLKASTDIYQAESALQIYNKAVAKNTFHTPVGLTFMKMLQDIIAKQHLVQRGLLNPIPVPELSDLPERSDFSNADIAQGRVAGKESPKALLDKLDHANLTVKRQRVIVIAMVILLAGVIITVSKLQYSAFTYFTNYEDEIREKIVNEYEDWEERLEKQEAEQEEPQE